MTFGISLARLVEETGVSATSLRRALDAAGVRRRRIGRVILYERSGAEAALGFDDLVVEVEDVRAEDVAAARKRLSR